MSIEQHAAASAVASHRPAALVTGGGSGIGAATARALTRHGWDVLICGRRREELDAVARETGASVLRVDITEPDAADALSSEMLDRYGRVDGLVLNAAIARGGPFARQDDGVWREMLDTNLVSAARLARACLPALSETKGSLVGIASLAALRASSLLSGYSATKAGLGLMLQSIAVEYGKSGVRSNMLCPGLIKTEMSAASLQTVANARGLTLDAAYREATRNVPLRRAADPDEVAEVVHFMLSPASSYITGAVIPVDGGASAVDVAALIYEPETAPV